MTNSKGKFKRESPLSNVKIKSPIPQMNAYNETAVIHKLEQACLLVEYDYFTNDCISLFLFVK